MQTCHTFRSCCQETLTATLLYVQYIMLIKSFRNHPSAPLFPTFHLNSYNSEVRWRFVLKTNREVAPIITSTWSIGGIRWIYWIKLIWWTIYVVLLQISDVCPQGVSLYKQTTEASTRNSELDVNYALEIESLKAKRRQIIIFMHIIVNSFRRQTLRVHFPASVEDSVAATQTHTHWVLPSWDRTRGSFQKQHPLPPNAHISQNSTPERSPQPLHYFWVMTLSRNEGGFKLKQNKKKNNILPFFWGNSDATHGWMNSGWCSIIKPYIALSTQY